MPNPDRKLYAPQKFFELPQYRLHTDFSKEADGENLATIASEQCFFTTNLLREVFSAQSRSKIDAPQKNFELPQYRLHTDFSKEAYAENLAKIASELSVLQPI